MTTLYCPKCGYNLTALTENRCPECGEGFDPDKLLALHREGISNRFLILQLAFAPAGFAVLTVISMLVVGSPMNPWLGFIVLTMFIFGLILLHALSMARSFVLTKSIQDGEDNTVWLFRSVWSCCILFTVVEIVLLFGYFLGGGVVISILVLGFP